MADLLAPPRSRAGGRWIAATVGLTVAPFVLAVLLAPAADAAPGSALVWLLFVGSSSHVGATAWFYTVPEVRAHMREHPGRYAVVPALLVVGAAGAAVVVPAAALTDLLLGYFAWQFFHFQKQNLGVTALAARAQRLPGLSVLERRALVGAGVGGILALLGRPGLLRLAPTVPTGWLLPLGGIVFAVSVLTGAVALARRPVGTRPAAYVVVDLIGLLFFAPVFAFSSPYAAVAGLTIAHGLQYLLLLGSWRARRSAPRAGASSACCCWSTSRWSAGCCSTRPRTCTPRTARRGPCTAPTSGS